MLIFGIGSSCHMRLSASEEAWGRVPLQPIGVHRGWGQCSVEFTHVLPFHPLQTMSSWSTRCAQGHCHVGTGLVLLMGHGNASTKHHNLQYASNLVATVWICPTNGWNNLVSPNIWPYSVFVSRSTRLNIASQVLVWCNRRAFTLLLV